MKATRDEITVQIQTAIENATIFFISFGFELITFFCDAFFSILLIGERDPPFPPTLTRNPLRLLTIQNSSGFLFTLFRKLIWYTQKQSSKIIAKNMINKTISICI